MTAEGKHLLVIRSNLNCSDKRVSPQPVIGNAAMITVNSEIVEVEIPEMQSGGCVCKKI